MGKASRKLDADRGARNRARRMFDSRLVKAKQAMSPGALATRVTGQIKRQARDTFDEAVEIADENRTVVAGTIAALAVWFLRKPIMSWLESRLATEGQSEEDADAPS